MLLESARDKFNQMDKKFNEKGTINHNETHEFLIEFIELLDKNVSQTNTSLFSNLVLLYIQTEPKQKCFKDLLHWIDTYIKIMEKPDESVYDNSSVKTI